MLVDDGDKVECHVCGAWFRSLGHHVWRTHNLTADEYRAIFGLAASTGLIGPGLHDTRSADAMELIDSDPRFGRGGPPMTPEQRYYNRRRHWVATEVKRSDRWNAGRQKRAASIRAKLPPKLCSVCGRPCPTRNRKTCSDACWRVALVTRPRVEQYCKVCGKGPLNKKLRTVTCSKACARRALSNAGRSQAKSRICMVCGVAFFATRPYKRKTCSDRCSTAARRQPHNRKSAA